MGSIVRATGELLSVRPSALLWGGGVVVEGEMGVPQGAGGSESLLPSGWNTFAV